MNLLNKMNNHNIPASHSDSTENKPVFLEQDIPQATRSKFRILLASSNTFWSKWLPLEFGYLVKVMANSAYIIKNSFLIIMIATSLQYYILENNQYDRCNLWLDDYFFIECSRTDHLWNSNLMEYSETQDSVIMSPTLQEYPNYLVRNASGIYASYIVSGDNRLNFSALLQPKLFWDPGTASSGCVSPATYAETIDISIITNSMSSIMAFLIRDKFGKYFVEISDVLDDGTIQSKGKFSILI
jgi:hypothetical protein